MASLLHTALFAGIEKAINALLGYDPATQRSLRRLQGRVLAIHITAPATTIFLSAADDRVSLMSHWDGAVETHLRGSLPALLRLTGQPVHNLKDSGVEVTGDVSLLATWQDIARTLDIDWEEMISRVTGDVVGHQSAEFLRRQKDFAQQRWDSLRRLSGEFFTEEIKATPGKAELNDFSREIDELRLRVDRLAARIERLLTQQP